MQIGEMIRTAGRRFGSAPAIVCDAQTMSFRAFDEATDRLGHGLLQLGLAAGDRVAVMLSNSIECLVAYYALAKSGLIRVPLNLRETAREHEYKMRYSGARALIHAEGVKLDAEFQIGPERLAQIIRDASGEPCKVDRDLEAPLRLGFTGGTTGAPKAVTLTTRGEVAEIANFMIDLLPDLSEQDVMLHAAPIAHARGAFFLPHLIRGAKQIIMPKLDAVQFLILAERERATITFIVPTMLAMILEQPNVQSAKLNFRRLCYGAAPIAAALMQRGINAFGNVFAQTYGQAESPMVITCLKPDEHDRIGSCGGPYALVEAKIVDDNDNDVATGEPGEIVCRGLQLMSRYWERPEETARAMRDGWLHTGDIGRVDEDGFFYIVDRKNDMLISGGYNVYPREVEDVLLAVPGVVEAAVVGLPDEKWGDRVYAVVSGKRWNQRDVGALIMSDAFIVDIIRSPFGKGREGGALANLHPIDLFAQVLQGLIRRTDVDRALIEDLIAGCVIQFGEQSSNVARQAWLAAGFPATTPGVTLDRKCGSAQQAMDFAAQGVMAGASDLVIAGGVEMMGRVTVGSNRQGYDHRGPMFDRRYPEGMVHQTISAELIAAHWKLSREEMDRYALRSHQRAALAEQRGDLARQIVAIDVATETGETRRVENDEGIRPDTSLKKLASLRPAFQDEAIAKRFPQIRWSVTAGNSSQVTDDATAMLIASEQMVKRFNLKPRAVVRYFAVVGDDPIIMSSGVIPATRKVLTRAGLAMSDIDVFEVNEAFASVVLAWAKELDADMESVNVNGGAIAFGHPVGASGGRLTASLLDALEQGNGRYGLQTMCESGGMANATIIERIG